MFWFQDLRISITVAVVTGLFIICWTPFFGINFAVGLCSSSSIGCEVLNKIPPTFIARIIKWLQYGNSVCNPIVYGLRNREFRQTFHKILLGWCGKNGDNANGNPHLQQQTPNSSLLWRCYGQCTSHWQGKAPGLRQDMSKFARSSKNCEKLEKLQSLRQLLTSSGKGGRRPPSENCDGCNFCDFSKTCEELEKSQFLLKSIKTSVRGGRRVPSKNWNFCNFSKTCEKLEKSISQFLLKLIKSSARGGRS